MLAISSIYLYIEFYFRQVVNLSLPFFLDDLGCSGIENSLLECLPQHNCGRSHAYFEDAAVTCLHGGNKCIRHKNAYYRFVFV